MIRNLAVRGRHMTVAHGSSTTNVVVSNSASTKRAATGAVVVPTMESIRCYSYDYNNSSHHQQHHRRHPSRSPSPSPSKRSQQVIPSNNIKVMSPRPNNNNNTQRSYGTAPLTESFMGSHVTHDSPVRHTTTAYHSFHEATPLMSMQQQQQQQEMTATTFHEDYDEWNTLSGYVTTGNSGPAAAAAETILSATSSSSTTGSSSTTDLDMDVVSDDEEWLPSSLGVSSAEQVLAMMDTSYYHASYQAKNNGHENQK